MSSSSPSSKTSRRGLPKWLKVTIITMLVVANLAVLALFWAINTGQNVLASVSTDDEVVAALSAPVGDTLTFLVVGSDSRADLDDLTNFGSAGGQRSDVVMLVRLDPDTHGARILSIPRDLWVDIPGHGQGKINAAYAFGGPALMVETIQQNLGIPVNHYVEVGFTGFVAMVDEIGGIEIAFPYPARDLLSGLDVDAGTQMLDGDMALAYARSRKYQELQNGSWVSVDANDIGRTRRQQEVVRAVLVELKTPSSITEAGDIASALAQHMTIDASLARSSAAALAWDFRGLLSGQIEATTLPVDGARIGGASVVLAREPEASQAISDFLDGAQLTSTPLRLQILNGNGVGGAAGRMSQELEAAGFSIVSIGDAENSEYGVTTVVVPSGSNLGASITSVLGFGVVVTGYVADRYDAIVIVGSDVS